MNAAETDAKMTLMQQMCQMFIDLDEDGSGTVTWAEFEENLGRPQMQDYLKAIDLDPQEAAKLFSLLDTDESGEIDGEELVSGCLRLHGSAKALELAAFMQEFTEFNRRWTAHAKRVERHLKNNVINAAIDATQTPIPQSKPSYRAG